MQMRLFGKKTRPLDVKMRPFRYENNIVARKMRFLNVFPHYYISALISLEHQTIILKTSCSTCLISYVGLYHIIYSYVCFHLFKSRQYLAHE